MHMLQEKNGEMSVSFFPKILKTIENFNGGML